MKTETINQLEEELKRKEKLLADLQKKIDSEQKLLKEKREKLEDSSNWNPLLSLLLFDFFYILSLL